MRLTGPQLLPVTMFFGSFAWSFVFVSLPFHIQRISTLEPAATLRWTGWIVGITSLVTVMTAPMWGRYAARGNPKGCYVAAAGSVWTYGGLRFLQVLSIGPVFPLIVSRLVQHAGGSAIGVINAARIGAGFIGPVAATSLLAWTSPAVVYLLLASIGLACVPLVRMREAGART